MRGDCAGLERLLMLLTREKGLAGRRNAESRKRQAASLKSWKMRLRVEEFAPGGPCSQPVLLYIMPVNSSMPDWLGIDLRNWQDHSKNFTSNFCTRRCPPLLLQS